MVDALIDERLKHINENLVSIRDHLGKLNGKVAEIERWRAEHEATSRNSDKELEEMKSTVRTATTFINQLKGGRTAVMQFLTTLCSAVAALAAIAALYAKH